MKRIVLFCLISIIGVACNSGGDAPKVTPAEQSDEAKGEPEISTETKLPDGFSFTVKTIGETMTDMAYEPKRLTVAAGSQVSITLENNAASEAMIHNIVFIKAGSQTEVAEEALEAGPDKNYIPENDNIIAASSIAKPGQTVSLEFTAPEKKGTYQYICTYPGHLSMKGILLVK